MKEKHTPEPWTIERKANQLNIVDDPDFPSVIAIFHRKAEAEANVKRAVDCVNACAGLNPEAVPELLEALKDTLHMLNTMTSEDFGKGKDRPIRERLESLLSKAKEEE